MPGASTSVSPFNEGGVRGFLHRPSRSKAEGIVLTHGAGGNCNAPLLVTAAEALSLHGFHVLRCDLPFRQQRPSGPPSPAMARRDREGLGAAVAELRRVTPARLCLGGQSYGGRQATILAAEEAHLVDGLLLFSYPLHPQGKPAQSRTQHFPSIRVPAVFVHGTADPFGSIGELREAIAAIPAPTKLFEVKGAGHDLKRGRFDFEPIVAELTLICAERRDR